MPLTFDDLIPEGRIPGRPRYDNTGGPVTNDTGIEGGGSGPGEYPIQGGSPAGPHHIAGSSDVPWQVTSGVKNTPHNEALSFNDLIPEAPMSVGGAYKAFDTGVANAVAGAAGLPRTIGDLGARGIQAAQNLVARQFGLPEDTRDLSQPGMLGQLPTAEEARRSIQRQYYGGATPYEPQNKLERGLEMGGEFLPNAMFPGGIASRALNVALPAGVTFAVKEAGGGPLAQAAAGLAGGAGAAKLANVGERMLAPRLPTAEAVKDIAGGQYRNITQAVLGEPTTQLQRQSVVNTIKDQLHKTNLTPENAGETHAALDRLAAGYGPSSTSIDATARAAFLEMNKRELARIEATILDPIERARNPSMIAHLESQIPSLQRAIAEQTTPANLAINPAGGRNTMGDFINTRRTLGNIRSGEDAKAAQMARDMIDTALETRTPGITQALQTADTNWNAAKVSENINAAQAQKTLRAMGTNSGMNLGNTLRQNAASMLNPSRTRYMAPSDQASLAALAQGTGTQNFLRTWGNRLGGGGGLGQSLLALAGGAAGQYEGEHPLLGGALPVAAGMLARRGFNRSVARQAAGVPQSILARSPAAQAMGAKYIPPMMTSEAVRRGLLTGVFPNLVYTPEWAPVY